MLRIHEVLRLPTTAETEVGPVIEHRPGTAHIRYDYEGQSTREWAAIAFSGVLALRLTPDSAVDPWMVEAYSRLAEIEESPWHSDLLGRAAGQGQTLPEPARHFLIYFDHYGCLEVLAQDATVEGGPAGQADELDLLTPSKPEHNW